MNVFTKRNALVGFFVLKALQRRRWQRRNRRAKLVAYVALGIVSAGILAGLLAVALRRQSETGEAEETQRLEGFASADDEDLAELGAGLPEPGFAA